MNTDDGSTFDRLFRANSGADIKPQTRPTSRKLYLLHAAPVRLLTGPLPLPAVYKRDGKPAKRQPKPLQIGDRAYVKLQITGQIRIVPFAMAGGGFGLIEDAQEGVHFEFLDES